MRMRRIAIASATAALVAGGAGAAVGATAVEDAKDAERNILGDAAKRLDKSPEEVRAALKAAREAELARAVKAGDITQQQADRIKARRDATGLVLGGRGGGPGHHRPGRRGRRGLMGASLADALGVTRAELRDALRAGRSIAEIARAEGKSLADVRKALRADVEKELAARVRAGDITQARADRKLERLDEHLERLDELPARGGRFGGPPPGADDDRP